MKKTTYILAAMLLMAGLFCSCNKGYQTVKGDALQARIYTLDNGLTVYLTRNQDKPEIQTFIAVRAGAQNDPQESTGLAHYLEHMMFKGTSRYGTTDYAAEKPNLDAIDSLYEVYGRTTDPELRKAIYHQIDSFSYESSKIAIANEFDKLMDGIGATGVNAFTSTEMTCYHEVIPAGELDRWAAIESGRFKDLVIRGFHTELEAVYEEFNMYSTQDQGKIIQAANNILYPELPYRQHEVIGTQEHLQNPSLLNVKKFWNTYYRPNNVAICLSGDLDFDKTIAVIKKHFGDWVPNNELPAVEPTEPTVLNEPKDTVVLGNEAPMLWLAWRFPGAAEKDAEIVEILAEVLQNGKCGLFDQDIDQQQRMLGSAAFPYESNDWTTFFLIGMAKEGQSLDEVRQILMEEIGKLKAGDFSDEMLQAIIANKRKSEMLEQQDNESRVMQFVTSFIYRIPWAEMVGRLDRQAKISKEDIVRVANTYFTDGYAAIYKQLGEDPTIKKINKPAISPIEMNRGINSAFVDSVFAATTESLTPQFLDFEKDFTRSEIRGREILYRQNTENELFSLTFQANGGTYQNASLTLAPDLLSYLGTEDKTNEQLQEEIYRLAGEVSFYAGSDRTNFTVSGLHENMAATLGILEDNLLNAKTDEDIYNELVADLIRSHEDSKTNQRSCFSVLRRYGIYGEHQVQKTTLTPQDMQNIRPEELLEWLREKALTNARIVYYGPASLSELKQMLDTCALLQGEPQQEPRAHMTQIPVSEPEVLVAPYNAPTIYYMAFADWGEVYNPEQEALVMLFNQYFSGSMGSVVFQEMREARALAYSAAADYTIPAFAGDDNSFYTYIISQTDKLQDCVEAFREICDNMPQSESTFEQAKSSLLKQLEQQRYTREDPMWAYISMTRKGWDHDRNADIYEEAKKLTMEDLVAFQKEHVAGRTFRYMILGDPSKIDMRYLSSLGKVKMLSLEDIFVY
ncbi:MAG: insulinase family protein [Bacteroidales bacterium]|nr:insulinase family protein [Candidatus Colicola faecequi]